MDNKNTQNDNKKTVGDRVGAAVEKAGHKIADLGAKKIGQKIHDLGDRMETHHKNPNHPHKV